MEWVPHEEVVVEVSVEMVVALLLELVEANDVEAA